MFTKKFCLNHALTIFLGAHTRIFSIIYAKIECLKDRFSFFSPIRYAYISRLS